MAKQSPKCDEEIASPSARNDDLNSYPICLAGGDEMRTKTLWIKDEYLQLILAGRKTIEVRVGYSNITRLQVGDGLLLNDQHPFVIRRIGRYASFQEMLAHENAACIAPDVPPGQLLEELRSIYPPEKEALGVVALEIKPERSQRK